LLLQYEEGQPTDSPRSAANSAGGIVGPAPDTGIRRTSAQVRIFIFSIYIIRFRKREGYFLKQIFGRDGICKNLNKLKRMIAKLRPCCKNRLITDLIPGYDSLQFFYTTIWNFLLELGLLFFLF
jgi:hypothetical protein